MPGFLDSKTWTSSLTAGPPKVGELMCQYSMVAGSAAPAGVESDAVAAVAVRAMNSTRFGSHAFMGCLLLLVCRGEDAAGGSGRGAPGAHRNATALSRWPPILVG